MLTLVIGGAASGKSEYAERLVLRSTLPRYYLATMQVWDAECAARVEKHRKMRAKKQVVINKEYNSPAEYTFSETAIMIKQNGESRTYAWDHIERAVVTPKTIGIYYAPECAMILPKQDFGDQFVPIFTIIATQLGQSKVRMR